MIHVNGGSGGGGGHGGGWSSGGNYGGGSSGWKSGGGGGGWSSGGGYSGLFVIEWVLFSLNCSLILLVIYFHFQCSGGGNVQTIKVITVPSSGGYSSGTFELLYVILSKQGGNERVKV